MLSFKKQEEIHISFPGTYPSYTALKDVTLLVEDIKVTYDDVSKTAVIGYNLSVESGIGVSPQFPMSELISVSSEFNAYDESIKKLNSMYK